MAGRGYQQLRADLRALGHDEPPLWVGVAVLLGVVIVAALVCAALPDVGAIR